MNILTPIPDSLLTYLNRNMDHESNETFKLVSFQNSSSDKDCIEKAIKNNKEDYYNNRKGLMKRVKDLKSLSSPYEQVFKSTQPKRKAKEQSRTSKSRGSRFRGVSKNGSKFQVFIMIHKNKRFIGVFEDEEVAARVYDKLAIIFHGHKVTFIIYYLNRLRPITITKLLSLRKS